MVKNVDLDIVSTIVDHMAHTSDVFKARYKLDKNKATESYYTYVPIAPHTLQWIFKDMCATIKDINNKKFIDIGAGSIAIPVAAKLLGFEKSIGLEYNELFVALSYEPNFANKGIKLIHGDLLYFDFSEFDVLYSYNPIGNKDLMDTGLENIVNTMKSEAVFYFISVYESKLFKKYKFIKRGYDVYKYIKL